MSDKPTTVPEKIGEEVMAELTKLAKLSSLLSYAIVTLCVDGRQAESGAVDRVHTHLPSLLARLAWLEDAVVRLEEFLEIARKDENELCRSLNVLCKDLGAEVEDSYADAIRHAIASRAVAESVAKGGDVKADTLTAEAIDGMEAGHEMDALVGRAVGADPKIIWIVTSDGGESCRASTNDRDGPWYHKQQLVDWLKEQQAEGLHNECKIGKWEQWPKYSINPGAAWVVVDLLTHTTKQWANIRQCSVSTEVIFEESGRGELDFEVKAEAMTMPLAVCRCALKWAIRKDPSHV